MEKEISKRKEAFQKKVENINKTECCFIEFEYQKNNSPACGIYGNSQYAIYGIFMIIKYFCKCTNFDFYEVLNILEDIKKINDYETGETE